MLISSFPIGHAEFHCSKFVQNYSININVGETLTLKAPSISQTRERFWIDEEGRDKIYGGKPCRFDCAGPAVVEVRRTEGALFPGKGGHEGFTEVNEMVGVGIVGGGVGAERVGVGRLGLGREDMLKEKES